MSDAMSVTALNSLLRQAARGIDLVKEITGDYDKKKKLLTGLIQARGLLSTLIDVMTELNDEDWTNTMQMLSVNLGPISLFEGVLEYLTEQLGEADSEYSDLPDNSQWPFNDFIYHEMTESLDRLKKQFLLAIANDYTRLSVTVQNEIHDSNDQLNQLATFHRTASPNFSRNQQWIVCSVSAANMANKLVGDQVMERNADAEWFLQHHDFEQWHEANHAPNTLVYAGRPGEVKTSISQAIHFFMKSSYRYELDTCVTYFSFSFFDKEKRKMSLALSDILQQMLLERPYLMYEVMGVKPTGGHLSSDETIKIISKARSDLRKWYIILDGLDECESEDRALFDKLRAIEPRLNILLTTQPGIFDTLDDCVTLSSPLNDSDPVLPSQIQKVEKTLEENARIAGYLDNDHEKIADAAKLLVEQSDGLWIVTNAKLESLAVAETKDIFERLLHNPNLGASKMCELMLENINHQPDVVAELAKKTLDVLLETGGTIEISRLKHVLPSELIHAATTQHLGRDPTTRELAETCISSCKGFVVFASEEHLQFASNSARSFVYFRIQKP